MHTRLFEEYGNREDDDAEGLQRIDAAIAPSNGVRVHYASELLATD